MKIFKNLAVALLLGSALVACHKDSDSTPAPKASGIEGKYVGKYGFDSETPNEDFIINVKAGGVFQEIGSHSGAPTGQGTWQLNGNKLTANYKMLFSPYNEYSVSLNYDASAKKLIGTWGFDGSATDGGKVDVTKQ
jgi:hypothetical protein